ncbi:MAG TPA: hypothetical protein VK530_14305 [Candidatus Acidoferrum sp.]|nr:hypothetical protein [Candidatus Acidoferrum sp.]
MKGFSIALVALALCVTGCSTFNYEWRREARQPTPANDITGRWEGTWLSDANAHNGALRCLITRQTNGVLQARYRATYQRWLKFGYTAALVARPGTNQFDFDGSADLGKLAGGVYRYSGHATPTNFFSTYQSKYDHGVFRMVRP